MRHIKKQSGFSTVETLLVILILAVVGFAGYTVWHNQHKTKAVATVQTHAKASASSGSDTKSPDVKSYAECINDKSSKADASAYPPTCTTPSGVSYSAADPGNFSAVGQEISIPSPLASACSGGDTSKASTAKLVSQSDNYSRVSVSPNCGDSFELIYFKTGESWKQISISHLGICFHTDYTAEPFISNPDLKAVVEQWCQQ